jgi:hypothetical protein
MATTIVTKNSATAGSAPSAGALSQGELAVNVADKRLFTKDSGGSVVEVGTNPGGAVTFTAGSASAPAITTTGDTNTGIFFPAADTIAFAEGGAERMRLDASGNLGLGVTPSDWVGFLTAFDLNGNGSISGGATLSTAGLFIGSNNYYNSGWKYKISGQRASYYSQADGVHAWNTAASGTAGNAITFTQVMTLDASGRLGVGTTSPQARIHLAGADANAAIDLQSTGLNGRQMRLVSLSGPAGGLAFEDITASAERMRISAAGNLLVGTTSGSVRLAVDGSTGAASFTGDDLNHYQATFSSKAFSASTHYIMGFFRANGSTVGAITHNDTNTTYSTTSDYRLKKDVAPMTGALAKVAQLKPCTYTWKFNDIEGEGFIAHELQEVFPSAVVGEKDDVNEDGSIKPQSIDTSFLVATLTAAIQEQQAIITQLQADVATLKGTV